MVSFFKIVHNIFIAIMWLLTRNYQTFLPTIYAPYVCVDDTGSKFVLHLRALRPSATFRMELFLYAQKRVASEGTMIAHYSVYWWKTIMYIVEHFTLLSTKFKRRNNRCAGPIPKFARPDVYRSFVWSRC